MKSGNIDFMKFPTTRYQGSKRKILPWIHENIKNINFDSVLDVFGGTASVSYLFKRMGKNVTYNDYLKFNSIIAESFIENNNVKLNENDLKVILKSRNKFNPFISNTFNGFYYLDHENLWLDKVVNNIYKMNNYPENVLRYKRAIALNAVFQSCMIKRPFNLFHRKNLNLRINDVQRTFGNKTSWDRSFETYFVKFVNEVNTCIIDTGKDCKAYNFDVFDIEDHNYDLVYLDPPYISKDLNKESTRYLINYHFLEGVANYSNWSNFIDYNSSILKFKDNYMLNHFAPNNVFKTFEKIIAKFYRSKLIISYKSDGIPSLDEIVKLLESKGKVTTVLDTNHKYALKKPDKSGTLNKECLIIGI